MKKSYPFQDLSTTDLPGETWKDIPQLAGYYQISNKGRVRRVAHLRATRHGTPVYVSALMLCQQTKPTFNAFTKDYRFSVRFSASLKGKRYHITTSRMVYHCFVKSFDLADSSCVVLYKDGDSLNICAENLYLGSPREKFGLMVKQNRWRNGFAEMTPEKRASMRQKAKRHYAQTKVYEISQYDLDGNRMHTYPNAADASKSVKISASHISSAARNRGTYTAGGYIWRRGSAPKVDIAKLTKLPGIHLSPLAKHAKRIGQYDFQGNLVQTFATLVQACAALKLRSSSGLRAALEGKQHTCKGFIWRKGHAPRIAVSGVVSDKSYRLSALSAEARKVTQYDLEGVRVQTFSNVHAASRKTGINRSTIQRVLTGRYVTGGGFLWQYGESLRLDLRPLKRHPGFQRSKLGIYMEAKRATRLATRFFGSAD